ncbi:MAG TPA: VOC family protein [Caulobacteraceae bacterium]|jgi:predicted enzyme related to lactoylglutathione lyase|nr:VOC family protein [Caulobacteraceae bacterium]
MTKPCNFIWYELMTNDAKAAEAFYGKVVGWTMTGYAGGTDYTILKVGDAGVGGIMGLTAEMKANGARPGWVGYVGVDDCDAYAARLAAAGGKVHRPPSDIPDIGRFAVVADPQGAVFILFTPAARPAPPSPPPADAVGTFGWRELMAGDMQSAFDFYADQFGWTKVTDHDMGEHGAYRLFATGGAEPVGGMMTKPAFVAAPPHWAYYIRVDGIKAAVERLTAGGGKVINGPMEVPTGEWIVQATDPDGAYFCLLSRAA